MSNRPTSAQLQDGIKWEVPAAEALAAKLWPGENTQIVAFPAFSHIDLAILLDGVMVAAVEVKRRSCKKDKYPSTIVLWEKHEAGKYLQKYLKCPAYCIVIWDDALGVVNLATVPAEKGEQSRNDRPNSKRVYAYYTLDQFTWHNELLKQIVEAVEE